MSFAPLRSVGLIQTVVRTAGFTTMFRRPMVYKSAISLETLYPNSSLKLITPAFNPDTKDKFSGYIPLDKLDITYSASSGPGGQNVNKVHTKVDLRFKLAEADWLHPNVKEQMLQLHGKKLTKEGYLVLRSDVTRSQQMNLADCLRKLRELLWAAAIPKKQPSQETLEKVRQRALKAARMRLAVKREDSLRRAQRQPPTAVDL